MTDKKKQQAKALMYVATAMGKNLRTTFTSEAPVRQIADALTVGIEQQGIEVRRNRNRPRMVKDPTMRYCLAEDCVEPPRNLDTPYCRHHAKHAVEEALRDGGITSAPNDQLVLCGTCNKAKKPGVECKSCKAAVDELHENIDVGPELFEL